MRKLVPFFFFLCLVSNIFAQDAVVSTVNKETISLVKDISENIKVTAKVTETPSSLKADNMNKANAPKPELESSAVEYEDIGVSDKLFNKKEILSTEYEYEYEDGTIESFNKSQLKKEKKKTPNKIAFKLSEDKKIIDGYNAPSIFFNLSDWSLSVPEDKDENGKADQIKEKELSSGYVSDYFYATDDGAMVFTCPIGGHKTSQNTSYTRVELREMLRAGNTSVKSKGPTKNNWVHKSSKYSKKAGGYNGELKATLAVNKVTTTGKSSQVGRVIIGQIHAKENEPVKLYYRKLPNNKKGSIYFAHETNNKKKEERYYELIGNKSNVAKNPENGIALNEKFTYLISLEKNELTVKIYRPFKPVVKKTIDIKKSGYHVPEEYMYFKAGVYNQNKSGNPEDFVQATFYELSNSHDGGL